MTISCKVALTLHSIAVQEFFLENFLSDRALPLPRFQILPYSSGHPAMVACHAGWSDVKILAVNFEAQVLQVLISSVSIIPSDHLFLTHSKIDDFGFAGIDG